MLTKCTKSAFFQFYMPLLGSRACVWLRPLLKFTSTIGQDHFQFGWEIATRRTCLRILTSFLSKSGRANWPRKNTEFCAREELKHTGRSRYVLQLQFKPLWKFLISNFRENSVGTFQRRVTFPAGHAIFLSIRPNQNSRLSAMCTPGLFVVDFAKK